MLPGSLGARKKVDLCLWSNPAITYVNVYLVRIDALRRRPFKLVRGLGSGWPFADPRGEGLELGSLDIRHHRDDGDGVADGGLGAQAV